MISPPFLKTGDIIGIAASGRKISAEDILAAQKTFASWGLNVVTSLHIHSNAHAYLAGSDAERLSDFQQFIDNPDIKAIICARGGYGTTRFVDQLNFESLFKCPKWIVGFSDVTAVHLKLLRLGIKSIHGTMPILFAKSDSKSSIDSLKASLFGESSMISARANPHNRLGKNKGQIMGGNLSLIVDSIGTSGDFDTNGKILVLEEVDEYKYKVDRMLMHLKRAGKLDNLAGLIIGHMTDIKDSDLAFGDCIEEMVLSKTFGQTYPIAFNFPIGHENPNLSWVHGSIMSLQVTEMGAQLLPEH